MFCVICLRTVIFSLERTIKRSTANVRMPRWRKTECRETKNGNMNNVAFYAVSSSSPYGYLCPKLKTQKSKHQFRTENTKHLYTKHNVTYRLPYIRNHAYGQKFCLRGLILSCNS